MIAAMAQWEREEIADRVVASIPIRAELGKSLGGPPPFGYQWKDGKLIPNPDEAPIRRLVHELFVECERKKTVARRLNEMGHRVRGGKPFSAATIRVLLDDPTPKGLRRANYTKREGGSRWVRKPESEWIYTRVEPILPAELWDRCQAILASQREKRKPQAKRAVQLFGGLTWCECGQKMYVVSNSPKYVCQKCRNKISIEDLEAIFLAQLKGFLLSPEEIRHHLEKADETISSLRDQTAALETERAKVAREMDAVYRLYLDGAVTSQGFA
jgi:site-specific DNA recombinase